MRIDKPVLYAHNIDAAEFVATQNLPHLYVKDDIVEIVVKKHVGVLINHKGKVPYQKPSGWIVSFEKNGTSWEYMGSEEF